MAVAVAFTMMMSSVGTALGPLTAGLPGFPHESGDNAWPVPGSMPQGGATALDGRSLP